MDINIQIANRAEHINQILQKYLPAEEGYQRTIFEAMNYSVKVGGKRLRPMLMQATYQMFGGKDAIIEPFMAAIEFIHTYSLVHDDLPAMDNDDYRRGKETTHKVYGEAMGILAGDALLNFAYETAAKAFDIRCDERTGQAYKVLTGKAGVYGMVGGQVVDVESEKSDEEEKKNITRDKLDFIYKLKTSALIESSMMIGAILAGTTEEEVSKLELIAQKLGLAFQIQDDILDVTSDAQTLGKNVGSDEANHKETYVTLLGIENSQKEVDRLFNEAQQLVYSLTLNHGLILEIIEKLWKRVK